MVVVDPEEPAPDVVPVDPVDPAFPEEELERARQALIAQGVAPSKGDAEPRLSIHQRDLHAFQNFRRHTTKPHFAGLLFLFHCGLVEDGSAEIGRK